MRGVICADAYTHVDHAMVTQQACELVPEYRNTILETRVERMHLKLCTVRVLNSVPLCTDDCTHARSQHGMLHVLY